MPRLVRRPRFESLEHRRVLATLGIDVRFLTDVNNAPGIELQAPVLRGETFWVDVRVQDVRDAGNAGIIALPLNLSWDPARFRFEGAQNLTAAGNDALPIDDPLVTGRFPLQRSVESYDPTAAVFDPAADPSMFLDLFNLRCVRGASLPNATLGEAIGVATAESFSLLRFTAIANGSITPFTVNLDGAMSFADAAPLDAVLAIGNAVDVPALASTVEASVAIAGGSISGTKFDDADGDGVRDTTEIGIAGVSIRLTPVNPTGPTRDLTTGNDGAYLFADLAAGTYSVSEVVPDNSLLTLPTNNRYDVTLQQSDSVSQNLDFGNFALVSLGGVKFNDLNGNGVQETGEDVQGGVTIRLDINSDADPSNDPPVQVTAADGTYQFTGVGPGMHTLTEVVPVGFTQTLPASGQYVVTTVSGQNQTTLNFGNRLSNPASISGTKFDDLNGNGLRDTVEVGKSGVTIRLDLDNDGSVDQTTLTSTDGSFQFLDVPAGNHAISEVVPSGSVKTTPVTDTILVTVGRDPVTGLAFGNFQLTILAGVVFNDADGDGLHDTGELVIPNASVELDLNNDGSVDRTASTGTDGRYQFDNIGPGTHRVRQVVPSGFAPTLPMDSQVTIDNRSGMSRNDLNFGLRATLQPQANSSISGSVYNDVDRDGMFDDDEVGLPGVTVQLFQSGGSTPLQTAITDLAGGYQFSNVAAGSYRVVEIQPARFIDASITRGSVLPSGEVRGVTAGLNAFDNIVIGEQETAIDYNFGEFLTAVTKRMFLSKTDVRAEMCINLNVDCQAFAGTLGDDLIRVEHLPDGRLGITINNQSTVLLSAEDAVNVLIDGRGGNDVVTVVGNTQNETFRAKPGEVVFKTTTQTVGVFNVADIRVSGGGGTDSAILRDSGASDALTASGNSLTLAASDGRRVQLSDVDTVQAVSAVDAPSDTATVAAIDFVLQLSGDWL